jgi:Asp-tRNA(Asn)/Glu-tRNA(Gln) amidotransferase C subunit
MQDNPRDTVRRIAALAGVQLAEERIDALVFSLPFVQLAVAELAAVDCRDADPAAPFPPRTKATT